MDTCEISIKGFESADLLVALLSNIGFESFLEEDEQIKAYVSAENYDAEMKNSLELLARTQRFNFELKTIKDQNWNAKWESDFKAVLVDDFCYVHADFHPISKTAKHSILINPKMAFGTAHHETTYMMMQLMNGLELENKSVFDYGCGTGILAILAKQLKAAKVIALDYDPKSVENTLENIGLNKQKSIEVVQGEAKDLSPQSKFDVILANINIIVLLANAELLSKMITANGILLLSGVLTAQRQKVLERYNNCGFKVIEILEKGEWSCVKFSRES